MAGPLEGIRVIDLTTVISGPLATMMLADQGAEVIKIEGPQGDYTRQMAFQRNGFSATYLNNNRGKRSVVADLKDVRQLEDVRQLAAGADVFVQNFRPGVIDRLGLGAPLLRRLNPGLVYLSIAGFGFRGPLADKPVYDPLVQALSSLTTVQAGADSERPRLVRTILPDKLTAMLASQAICSALYARERTGVGQEIELSMLDGMIFFLWSSDMDAHTFVDGDEVPGESQPFADLIYQVIDGYVSIAVMQDRHWEGLAKAVDRVDILQDARFATVALREVNRQERLELTQSLVARFTQEDLIARLEQHGVPCAPVLRRTELIRHPQVLANGALVEYDHPEAGRLRQARHAAVFKGTPLPSIAPAPTLGEHSSLYLGKSSAGIQGP